jgi:hypothetical protein
MRLSLSQIARDAGGPHLASLRAFTVFMPIWLLGSLLGLPYLDSPLGVGYALVANTVGFVFAWLVLLVLRVTLFRERARSHVNLWIVVLGGALVGAAKGFSTMGILELLWSDGSHSGMLIERVLSAALVGMWFLPSTAFIEATMERLQVARSLTSAEELARSRSHSPLAGETSATIDALLTNALDIVTDASQTPKSRSEKLRSLSHDHLRPLIEQLWSESREGAKPHWLLTARTIAAARPLSPAVVTTGMILVSSGLIFSTVGIAEGFGRLSILALSSTLFAIVAKSTRIRKPLPGALLMGTCAIAYTATNEALGQALLGPFGDFSPGATGTLNAAIFFTMLVISALITISAQEVSRLRSQLDELFGRENWASDDLGDLNRLRQRELATVLHGQFQNGLLSAELALRGTTDASRPTEFITLVEQLRARLVNNQPAEKENLDDTLSRRLSTLSERWRGMVEITTTGAEVVSDNPELTDFLFQVCEEAVSNASRHGLAQRVSIELINLGPQIRLTVTDDGVGPRLGKPGLGTFLLNSRDKTTWTLSSGQNQAGSTLTITSAKT